MKMRVKRRNRTILIIVFLAVFTIVRPCFADNFFDKLKRGVINTLTGWVEIPKEIIKTSKEETLFKGLTVGLAKGIGRGVTRTAVGLCETTTFIAPIPKKDYEPMLRPEHVFEAEEGREYGREGEEYK